MLQAMVSHFAILSSHYLLISKAKHRTVHVQSVGYKVPNWNPIIQSSEISDMKLYNAIDEWQLECPSILFCYLPEKETGPYNCVKSICDLFIGGNTQCIVQKTASAQKQLGQ